MLRFFAAFSILGCLMTFRISAADAVFEPDATAALKKSEQSGKPVLILIRNFKDLGSIDCGHWLTEDASFQPALGKFECTIVWHGDASLKDLDAPKAGLLFLTPKGEVIRQDGVPAFRSKLHELLDSVIAHPDSADAALAAATAELAKGNAQPAIDTSRFKDTIIVLQNLGRADEALPLKRALAGINLLNKTNTEADDAIESALLEIQAGHTLSGQMAKLAKDCEDFQKAEKPDTRKVKLALKKAARNAGPDEDTKKTFAAAQDAFDALDKTPESADAVKAAKERAGALIPVAKKLSENFKSSAGDLDKKFEKDHPDSLTSKLKAMGALFNKLGRDEKGEKRCVELLHELLKRPMKPDEFLEVAGYLMYPIWMLNLDAERVELADRVQKEIGIGRIAADVFMDQADMYYTEGKTEEAEKLWKLVEAASKDGESPSFLRNVHAMRALVEDSGGGSQVPAGFSRFNGAGIKLDLPAEGGFSSQKRWAARTVSNVVVLAPDFESYAKTIALWTDTEFFPVLIQDDIYAPKFIAAFKPAEVILMPSGGKNALPPIEELRHTIQSSWTPAAEKAKVAATPSDDDLRARLTAIGTWPVGVVFGDGESGEMAGALALAAGRFQGLEILQRTTVGNEGHIGAEEHYLDLKRALILRDKVNEGLKRWGLPEGDRWAYVTIAGKYPYRYSGDSDNWGGTYATEDMLGRAEDSLRIAVCGRLMGDNARSSYQAMCSLFLQPESAFLFNTYGTNPHNEWGQFNMNLAETLLKERLKLPLVHLHDEGANLDTFRAHEIPWNRDGLVCINSSGWPDHWSVAGGDGTTDDFLIGTPCAVNIVHSGSAAELYAFDTIAHRAVWGGAFWYFGSSAEPLLDAFNPLNYVAPRITRGVPLAAAFRQRTSQNRFYPWRLMLVGDPQYALREQPAKRAPLGDDLRKALLPDGAPKPVDEKGAQGAQWAKDLRTARWMNQPAAIPPLLEKLPDPKSFDGADAAIAIEEFLKADRCADAVKLWNGLSDEARKNEPARVYARYAAGHLMDLAQAAKDVKALTASFTDMISTDPPRMYVERWNGRAVNLASAQKADADYAEWLTKIIADPHAAAFKSYFEVEARGRKETWTDDDRTAALTGFAELVKSQNDPGQLTAPFKTLAASYLSKLKGTTAEKFLTDVKAIFKAETPEAKRLAEAMAPWEAEQQLFKDWLILGPFKDQKIGAWENVGPKDGKTAPDFTAKFTDTAPLEWTRPFKAGEAGIIDLAALLKPNTDVYAYAAASVTAEKDFEGLLLLGSDDGVTAWLDGKEIHRNPVNRGVRIDQDKVPLKLSAGAHSIVLRIDQGTGGWGFCARIADKDGKPAAGIAWRCARE